ncbi:RyR domain-containing protein [Nonomuraea sp. NPDC050328]|uniref:RyR domain-containing protein n=1 Tax=Nonomuraea sp. NPDC050328 TaxID=3364361 RepID=UPI003793CD74
MRNPAPWLLRASFVTLTIASLLLGLRGFAQHLDALRQPYTFLDLLYYDLQLFVLDPLPLDMAARALPLSLEIARFTAPATTIYVLVAGGVLLFSTELRRFRARRSRGHAVVCGSGPLAIVLVERLRAEHRRVVMVSRTAPPTSAILHVAGDARDPEVLRTAGLPRAATLYACEEESATNIGIAQAAHALAGRHVATYALIPDPDLCLALRARRLGLPESAGRLDFFSPDALAARVLLERDPVRGPVIILGLSRFGQMLLLEMARQWHQREQAKDNLAVTVVDARASEEVALLTARHAATLAKLDITPLNLDADEVQLPGNLPMDPPERVYVCYDDQNLALKIALTSPRLWLGGVGSLVIRVEHATALRDAVHDTALLEGLDGALRIFAVAEAAGDPRLIGEDLVETLARWLHKHYLTAQYALGDHVMFNPSMVPWDDLPAEKKESNRQLAADIGRKLRGVRCTLGPRVDPEVEYTFTDQDIESMAKAEHDRWVIMMLDAGWKHGPARDDERKSHPDVCDWSNLSEEARTKDRNAVQAIPNILAVAGFQVVRMKRDAR